MKLLNIQDKHIEVVNYLWLFMLCWSLPWAALQIVSIAGVLRKGLQL